MVVLLCPVCSQKALDPLGHLTHALVTRHNLLLDEANLFHQAHMGVIVEAGYGLTYDNSHYCPADVLVARYGKMVCLQLWM